MTAPRLVIFDNDGVLVDSEAIACAVEMQLLAEIGHPITAEDFAAGAVGRRQSDVRAMLERVWGRPLPADYAARLNQAAAAAFRARLRPVAGMADLIRRLDRPVCVASSGSPAGIALKLDVTGLAPLLPHRFSGETVAHGKPAPDLFLLAAERMGVAPDDCVVIEDSVPGIQAAKAAGMTAIGFIGASHEGPGHGPKLVAAGADQIASDAAGLARLLAR